MAGGRLPVGRSDDRDVTVALEHRKQGSKARGIDAVVVGQHDSHGVLIQFFGQSGIKAISRPSSKSRNFHGNARKMRSVTNHAISDST